MGAQKGVNQERKCKINEDKKILLISYNGGLIIGCLRYKEQQWLALCKNIVVVLVELNSSGNDGSEELEQANGIMASFIDN